VAALKAALEAAFLDSRLGGEYARITADQLSQLVEFGARLAERAQLFNLTRLTSPEEMAILHFLDTFFLSRILSPPAGTVIDIGTGPGVPGIPLAILRPDLLVTMIDGTGKKARFVQESVAALDLKNGRALQARAEEHLRSNRYGTGVLRAAVKPARLFEILAETGSPLESVVFMLGADGPRIASAIKSRRYRRLSAEPYRLPGQRKDRYLVVYQRKDNRR
jgi:16S rRNA (guanine527-N7)-methyltransferase